MDGCSFCIGAIVGERSTETSSFPHRRTKAEICTLLTFGSAHAQWEGHPRGAYGIVPAWADSKEFSFPF